jgi:hypothetical protein
MRPVRAVVEALRLTFAREQLGEVEEAPPPGGKADGGGILRVLFLSREPLGEEPEEPPGGRTSLLRAIFARETLPLDPEPPSAPRRGRLAALFAPEKLDDSP